MRWVPFDEAGALLSFATERELVARPRAASTSRPARRRRTSRRAAMTDAGDDGRGRRSTRPPLVERHRALGARLIEFGGWLMPVQYAGILEEHRAVRERAGLFDLSHMGELFVEGADAGDALAAALVTRPADARRRAAPSTR